MSRDSRPQSPAMLPQLAPAPPRPDPNVERLMQVKVLYTFDDAKTNCLARCPHPVPVRTAMLDAKTEVGIIELRTCIQAIVTASPELVAKLGQDFTIYAYDYSEYETPLVGQGMLSWVLASSSSTPTAPADQSRTPVTGRVTRGGLNLFSAYGGGETLEVKLKLVPVPTSLQSDYLESMQKYRDASNFTNQGGNTAAWHDFVRANPSFSEPTTHVAGGVQQAPNSAVPQPQCGVLSPMSLAPQFNQSTSENNPPSSRGGSRPSTPKGRRAAQSRQSSRASSTRDRPALQKSKSTASRIEKTQPAQVEEHFDSNNGQPRKRARVEQTNWRGPSALNPNNDSLRVAASTAASIRGHAVPSAAAQIAAVEAPVRPPTPRPHATARPLKRTNTSLAHDAMMHRPQQSSALAGGTLSDNEYSVATSPESQTDSAGATPIDMPSSPPVLGQNLDVPSSPILPPPSGFFDSGFGSGSLDDFFTDKTDELGPLPEDDNIQAMPSSRSRPLPQTFPTSELSITEEVPGDPSLLPGKPRFVQNPSHRRQPPTSQAPVKSNNRKGRGASASRTMSYSTQSETAQKVTLDPRDETRQQPVPEQTLPQAAEEPALGSGEQVARPTSSTGARLETLPLVTTTERASAVAADQSQISAGHQVNVNQVMTYDLNEYRPAQSAYILPKPLIIPEEKSEELTWDKEGASTFEKRRDSTVDLQGKAGAIVESTEPDSTVTDASKNQAGSGIKRKNCILGRLQKDLSEGKMPPFCGNCGEIETPTWRRCYVQTTTYPPPTGLTQSDDKDFLFSEITETNDQGEPLSYRTIRRNVHADDQEWEELKLCNSCGMWLFKMKSMRPPEKWGQKKPKGNGTNRRKNRRSKSTASEIEPQSDANDAGSPADIEGGTPIDSGLPQFQEDPFRAGTSRSELDARNGSGPKKRLENSDQEQHLSESRQADLDDTSAMAALQKAILASPPKFPGSQASPINLEDDGQSPSVRRLLFPSPRKEGEVKTLDVGNLRPKSKSKSSSPLAARAVSQYDLEDKENDSGLPQLDGQSDVFKTPLRRSPRKHSPYSTPSKSQSPSRKPVTPFTASINQMLSSDVLQSPGRYSDQAFDMFNDQAFTAPDGFEAATDFNNDGYLTDMPVPQSDADFFPVFDDIDMNIDNWDGGPLMEGELDALLKEAGDSGCETYFSANGIAEDLTELAEMQ